MITSKEIINEIRREIQMIDQSTVETMGISNVESLNFVKAKERHGAYVRVLKLIDHYDKLID